jgi:hypothetical protein
MSVPRQNLHLTWRRRLHNTLEGLTLLGAAEQTRLSWAKPAKTTDDIPAAYHAYLRAHLPELSACLPAVLTPTFHGFLRRENEKLVFTYNERLYIIEQTPTGLLPVVFPFDDINYVEVGGILLKAWVRVNGLIADELVSAILKYNSVTQHLFDPLVAQIRRFQSHAKTDGEFSANRRASNHVPDDTLVVAETRLEQAKFDPLRTGHFKFMNYARRSLQPGERVVAYTLQPELRQARLSLLGRPLSLRSVETAHLCILTDRELIVIRDDPSSLQGYAQTRYGGIWDYLPLSRIQGAAITERPSGHLALVVYLPGSDRMEVLFSAEKRPELEQVCARLEAFSTTP